MGVGRLFNFFTGNDTTELPDIYPFGLKKVDFSKADIIATYVKILTDTFERTHGLKDEHQKLLFDNCLESENSHGLIRMLADAMANKAELFLVYKKDVNVLRKATREEEDQIRKEYKEKAESKTGVYISFKEYRRTEMLLIYSDLEYCVLSSLHKGLNISKAVQLKFNKLRESTSLSDASIVKAQAKEIAQALKDGKDIYLDNEDEVTTTTPDTSHAEKAIAFLDAKRAYILGLPQAYISGVQTTGIGSTGEADQKAVERGLKQYFFSIVEPTCEVLWPEDDVEFKSEDFRQITTGIELLKTFDLVSDEYLSRQAKTDILRRVFDVNPEDEEKALEEEAAEREAEEENNPPQNDVDPNAAPPIGARQVGTLTQRDRQ